MPTRTASGPHNSLMSGVAVTTARGVGEHATCLPLSPTGGGAWSPPPQHTPNVGGNDTTLPGHRAELRRKYPSPWGQDEGITITSRVSCAGPGMPAGARRGTSQSPRPTQEVAKWEVGADMRKGRSLLGAAPRRQPRTEWGTILGPSPTERQWDTHQDLAQNE